MRQIGWLAMLLLPLIGFSAEVGGVRIDDTVKVEGVELNLTGAGVRSKWGIAKVYVGALYTSGRSVDAESIIFDHVHPRRITLTMLRNVGGDRMQESLADGLESNATENEMASLAPKIKEMETLFDTVKEVNTGDLVTLDFIPEKGTRISVRGTTMVIAGDDFARAMMRIWIGKQPVNSSLKWAMLGIKN